MTNTLLSELVCWGRICRTERRRCSKSLLIRHNIFHFLPYPVNGGRLRADSDKRTSPNTKRDRRLPHLAIIKGRCSLSWFSTKGGTGCTVWEALMYRPHPVMQLLKGYNSMFVNDNGNHCNRVARKIKAIPYQILYVGCELIDFHIT